MPGLGHSNRVEAAEVAAHLRAHEAPPTETVGQPAGVTIHRLGHHSDSRGAFSEFFRAEWGLAVEPKQWSMVRSKAGTMRGVHMHPVHTDYLTVAVGEVHICLRDLRSDSATTGMTSSMRLSEELPLGLEIPNGVAHGFLALEDSLSIHGVDEYWHPDDEVAMIWDDPALALDWPQHPTLISDQDGSAPAAAEALAAIGWPPAQSSGSAAGRPANSRS